MSSPNFLIHIVHLKCVVTEKWTIFKKIIETALTKMHQHCVTKRGQGRMTCTHISIPLDVPAYRLWLTYHMFELITKTVIKSRNEVRG